MNHEKLRVFSRFSLFSRFSRLWRSTSRLLVVYVSSFYVTTRTSTSILVEQFSVGSDGYRVYRVYTVLAFILYILHFVFSFFTHKKNMP